MKSTLLTQDEHCRPREHSRARTYPHNSRRRRKLPNLKASSMRRVQLVPEQALISRVTSPAHSLSSSREPQARHSTTAFPHKVDSQVVQEVRRVPSPTHMACPAVLDPMEVRLQDGTLPARASIRALVDRSMLPCQSVPLASRI